MPSIPDVTTASPVWMLAVPLRYSSFSRLSPVPVAIAWARVSPTVTATAAFRSIRSCTLAAWGDRHHDSPDRAGRRDHRHVDLHAVGRAAVDGDAPEVGGRARPDHFGGERRHLAAVAQVEQPPEAPGLRDQGAVALDGHLQRADLLLERQIVRVHVPQRRVLVPRAAHAADDRRRPALHLGEHAEDERLQHRHARPRVDLRGDQDDVAGRKRQEQQAAPPPDIGDGH